MIERDLLSQQITILTPVSTTDAYGNTVHDWSTPASRTVAAYVRPVKADEDLGDRDAVTSAWQVHTNDLTVTALERVVFDGVTYAIDGEPQTWAVDPRGQVGHAKFQLRRVDG